MATPTKRARPKEFDDLSSIPRETLSPTKAKIHAVITNLSPIKTSTATNSGSPSKKQFFQGTVNDGVKKIRLVGFTETQQAKLSKFYEAKEPVTLTNCTVKKAKDDSDVEVLVNDYTEIQKSDKTFNITDWSAVGPTDDVLTVQIKQIQDLPNYQRVTVNAAKVTHIEDTDTLDDGRQFQNVIIADTTGETRLTLWQQHINTLQLLQCYKLNNVTVKSFANKHYLYTPKTDSLIEPIDDDMPEVTSSITTAKPSTTTISTAIIISIPFFRSQRTCLSTNCCGEVLHTHGKIGRCSTCNMPQQIDMCKQQCSAKLHIASESGKMHLFANGQILAQIAEIPLKDVTEDILLNANSFTLSYNDRMTIISVSR